MAQRFIWLGVFVSFVLFCGCTDSTGGNDKKDDDKNPGNSDGDTDTDTDTDNDTDTDTDADPQGNCQHECVDKCLSEGGSKKDGVCEGDQHCCQFPSTDGDTDTDVDGDSDGDADTDVDGDSDGDADTDVDGDSDGDADTDVDGDSDGDADTDVDGDADSDTDTDSEGCTVQSYSNHPGEYCNIYMDCGGTYKSASCEQWENDNKICSCEGSNNNYHFELPEGLGDENPCEFVIEICDDISPKTIGEPDCEDIQETSDDWHCQTQQQCTQKVQLTEDITTEMSIQTSLWCDAGYMYEDGEDNDNSDWYCYCSTPNKSTQYNIAALPDGSSPCSAVYEACINDTKVVTDNEVDCSIRNLNQNPGHSCGIDYECSQEGTLSGTDVTLTGNLNTYCTYKDGDDWSCTCSGGNKEEVFLLSGDDAWKICEEAGPKCLDIIGPEEVVQNGEDDGPIPVDIDTGVTLV